MVKKPLNVQWYHKMKLKICLVDQEREGMRRMKRRRGIETRGGYEGEMRMVRGHEIEMERGR